MSIRQRLSIGSKGQMAGSTAGMIIALVMVAIVLGTMLTNLESAISLTGSANTTFHTIQTLGWVALTILAVGVIAFVGNLERAFKVPTGQRMDNRHLQLMY